MKYTMTKPCNACPFLKDSGFKTAQLERYVTGEFGCHKACDLTETEDDGSVYKPNQDTPHCAGALIYLEKRKRSTQMMRICERIGMYDHTKLDMGANVR